MAYFQIAGPQGAERADWQVGLIAATMANIHRDPHKRSKAYSPTDFMPRWGRSSSPNLMTKVEQINRLLGGKDLRT